MKLARLSRLDMAYRVACVLIGGYALWSGGVILLGVALRHTGLSHTDAMLNAAMPGSLLYVGIIVWGFGAPPRTRPATTIAVLGVLAVASAILIGRAEAVG